MTKTKIEFSKLILVSVMLTYFIALIFIMAVIWKMTQAKANIETVFVQLKAKLTPYKKRCQYAVLNSSFIHNPYM